MTSPSKARWVRTSIPMEGTSSIRTVDIRPRSPTARLTGKRSCLPATSARRRAATIARRSTTNTTSSSSRTSSSARPATLKIYITYRTCRSRSRRECVTNELLIKTRHFKKSRSLARKVRYLNKRVPRHRELVRTSTVTLNSSPTTNYTMATRRSLRSTYR